MGRTARPPAVAQRVIQEPRTLAQESAVEVQRIMAEEVVPQCPKYEIAIAGAREFAVMPVRVVFCLNMYHFASRKCSQKF